MKTTYKKKANNVVFSLSGFPQEVGEMVKWIEEFRAEMRRQLFMQERNGEKKYQLNVNWSELNDKSTDHESESKSE